MSEVKKAPPTIVREKHPNPDYRTYHVNSRISEYGHIHTFGNPFANHEKADLKETGKIGTAVVKGLQGDNGIDDITLQPFELSIKRGKAFTWEQIEPVVFNALRAALGLKRIKVQDLANFKDSEIPLFSRLLSWIQWPKHV